MSSKSFIWIGMFVGTSLGGMIPLLWGESYFSVSSVILTAVGGGIGIWAGYSLSHWL